MDAIQFRAEAPTPQAFLRLFATTGWDVQGRLTVEDMTTALASTWRAVSAYCDGDLVGTGRIVGDGVLHALLADVIVDPALRGRGIGGEIVRRLVAECRRNRVLDVQLFCATGHRRFYERLGFVGRPEDAPGMELGPSAPADEARAADAATDEAGDADDAAGSSRAESDGPTAVRARAL